MVVRNVPAQARATVVRYWGVYRDFSTHTKGFCWAALSLSETEHPVSLKGKKGYHYDDPKDPGNLIYCEDCLRRMGVLW